MRCEFSVGFGEVDGLQIDMGLSEDVKFGSGRASRPLSVCFGVEQSRVVEAWW